MIIYEKENKLNVSFENSINETPDIQIGKDGDKTQILVDGQESSGSGSGSESVNVTMIRFRLDENTMKNYLDETAENIFNATMNGFVKGYTDGGFDACLLVINATKEGTDGYRFTIINNGKISQSPLTAPDAKPTFG